MHLQPTHTHTHSHAYIQLSLSMCTEAELQSEVRQWDPVWPVGAARLIPHIICLPQHLQNRPCCLPSSDFFQLFHFNQITKGKKRKLKKSFHGLKRRKKNRKNGEGCLLRGRHANPRQPSLFNENASSSSTVIQSVQARSSCVCQGLCDDSCFRAHPQKQWLTLG